MVAIASIFLIYILIWQQRNLYLSILGGL